MISFDTRTLLWSAVQVNLAGSMRLPCVSSTRSMDRFPYKVRNSISMSALLFADIPPDYSVSPEEDLSSFPKTVAGTVRQLLDSARSGTKGKILNGLEFPRWNASVSSTSFSSDLVAWHHTRGVHKSPLNSTYPVGDMNWGLAGTADTLTFLHIDSDGLNTGVKVKCGRKVWGALRERVRNSFSSISTFTDLSFSLDKVMSASNYDVEAVVLQPNDLL